MEHYSVLQGNEMLKQAIMRMNLRHTMPNERSQLQKATHSRIAFVGVMLHSLRLQDLFPWAGIEPKALAVKALSPNHWTAGEFPVWFHLDLQNS